METLAWENFDKLADLWQIRQNFIHQLLPTSENAREVAKGRALIWLSFLRKMQYLWCDEGHRSSMQ